MANRRARLCAIAISYLDRQALPVAVAAIQKDIPLTNTEFGALTSMFLLAYALMYAGGGVLIDRLGTRRGIRRHHDLLVDCLREPRAGERLLDVGGQPLPARRG